MKPRNPSHNHARTLRNGATDAERLLWRYLSRRQMVGVKFRRQQPIERYVVDFVSFSKRIVIELDGGQHAEAVPYDQTRDACLKRNGFRVLRFWNNEVFENIDGVLAVIRRWCLDPAAPTPRPPPVKGGGDQAL